MLSTLQSPFKTAETFYDTSSRWRSLIMKKENNAWFEILELVALLGSLGLSL